MFRAFRAIAIALHAVSRAPGLVALGYFLLLAAVVPPSLVVARGLTTAFDQRRLDVVAPERVDAGWFLRSRQSALPLSPALTGFAAPLTNADDLLSLRPGAPVIIATVVVWGGIWTLWLTCALQFFAARRRSGFRGLMTLSLHVLPRTAAILIAVLVTYLISAGVFGLLPDTVSTALLPVLVAILLAVTVVASYARAHVVMHDMTPTVAARTALRTMWLTRRSVSVQGLVFAACWTTGWLVLALVDLRFMDVSPTSLIVATQLLLVLRIAVRLVWEASVIELVREAPGR